MSDVDIYMKPREYQQDKIQNVSSKKANIEQEITRT